MGPQRLALPVNLKPGSWGDTMELFIIVLMLILIAIAFWKD